MKHSQIFPVGLLVIVFSLSLSISLYASTGDTSGLLLEDGTVVQGRVLKITPEIVTIDTRDGRVLSYPCSDVEVVGNEQVPEPPRDYRVEFGISYFKFDYKEELTPPHKSTENGWLPGVYFSLMHEKKDSIYARALLEFAAGDVKYDGSAGGIPAVDESSYQELARAEVNFGYTFLWKNVLITPYTGYGYRYWRRGEAKLIPLSTGGLAASYKEIYNWHYLPVGVRSEIPLTAKFSVEPNIGARIVFSGSMKAYLSDYANSKDVEFTLGNKVGWYAEIPLRYRHTSAWSLSVTPWYEYSGIGESGIEPFIFMGKTGFAVEPSSRTHQYGVSAGIAYSF